MKQFVISDVSTDMTTDMNNINNIMIFQK